MAESLAALLDPREIGILRAEDICPTLALYRIAHEGVSGGAVLGVGSLPKRWTGARIAELAQRLEAGAPVFRGHSEGIVRIPIGKVLKGITQTKDGETEAFALVHITDPTSAEDALMKILDTASIEADLSLEPTREGWRVAQVERVTGIALAQKSGGNSPGFPRAALIAAVRESLAPENDNGDEPDKNAPERPDSHAVIEESLAGKNLTRGEWEYVHRRVGARLTSEVDRNQIIQEVTLCLSDLDEAKRLYRRPSPPPAAPAEKRRGPMDYTNVEHNELIPR